MTRSEQLYLEDLYAGQRFESRSHTLDIEQIKRFATDFDPQPFHTDEEAAKDSFFGSLAASGWHTAAMTMRMIVEGRKALGAANSLGSPGVDELRWLHPVYPGDTLRVESEVMEVRPSRSRPNMGLIRSNLAVFNQHGDKVMTFVSIELVPRREC